MTINPSNERIKHAYFGWLSAAKQLHTTTIDMIARDIADFETFTGGLDFKRFNSSSALGYKKQLLKRVGSKGRERLSYSTIYSTLRNLRCFFFWLADQSGYKSRLRHADSQYFNLSRKESAAAKVSRQQPVPSLDEVLTAFDAMPDGSDIERRDRAIIALIAITGSRDDAVASMRLKHVDLEKGVIHHDPREMRIKFSKSYPTYLLDVDLRLRAEFESWVKHLINDLGYPPDAALFPKTRAAFGVDALKANSHLSRECWANAEPIRKLFKKAFARVELPDYKPHSLRKMLTRIGMEKCKAPEEFKSFSQNLGHEEVLTTLMSYGRVPDHRQGEILKRVMERSDDDGRALELGWKMLETMRGDKQP